MEAYIQRALTIPLDCTWHTWKMPYSYLLQRRYVHSERIHMQWSFIHVHLHLPIHIQWPFIHVYLYFDLIAHDTIKRKDATLPPAPRMTHASGEDSHAARVQFSNTSLFFYLVAPCFIELLWRITKARVVSFGMNCTTSLVNFDTGSKKRLSAFAKSRTGFVVQVRARWNTEDYHGSPTNANEVLCICQ